MNSLHVTNQKTGHRFLVNTGEDISQIPKNKDKTLSRFSLQLFAANVIMIDTFSEGILTLDLGLRRSFYWKFCVVDKKKS